MLIPCRPARFDLDAVVSTLQIVRAANTPAIVIINAAPRGKLAGEAKAALERQGATVLEIVLHQRAAYGHAVIDGRSVHEYEPNGAAAAAAEIEELYNVSPKHLLSTVTLGADPRDPRSAWSGLGGC